LQAQQAEAMSVVRLCISILLLDVSLSHFSSLMVLGQPVIRLKVFFYFIFSTADQPKQGSSPNVMPVTTAKMSPVILPKTVNSVPSPMVRFKPKMNDNERRQAFNSLRTFEGNEN